MKAVTNVFYNSNINPYDTKFKVRDISIFIYASEGTKI